MKKLVTLLLALLLSLSLTVPALAAVKFIILKDETLSGPDPKTYEDKVVITGNVTVENGARITFKDVIVVIGSLTVEAGASLTSNWNMQIAKNGSLTVEAGATVTTNGNMLIEEKVTVGGRLEGKSNMTIGEGSILLLPGGELDIMLGNEPQANDLVGKLLENGEEKVSVNKEQTKDGFYHVTAHGHNFVDGICTICDDECKHEWWTEGICDTCGRECLHETKTNGVCDICGLCLHETWTDGVCDDCGYSCPHEKWTEDGVCTVCGVSAPAMNVSPENAESGVDSPGWMPLAAFTLSGGNLWIIGAGAGVILAVTAAMVIHKKRKN